MIKYIATFVLGAGVGGVVTWRLVKKYYADLADEEIESVKAQFEKKENKDTSEKGPFEEAQAAMESLGSTLRAYGSVTTEGEKAKMAYNLVGKNPPHEASDEHTKIAFKDYISEEAMEETDEEREEREAEEDNEAQQATNVPPYVITPEDFSDNFQHHEKLTLQYYLEDDVLCDEGETTIEDINYYIGEEALNMILNGVPTVWVRNEKISIDYEILAMKHSYAEMVLGYGV